jgi:hypothetical protein
MSVDSDEESVVSAVHDDENENATFTRPDVEYSSVRQRRLRRLHKLQRAFASLYAKLEKRLPRSLRGFSNSVDGGPFGRLSIESWSEGMASSPRGDTVATRALLKLIVRMDELRQLLLAPLNDLVPVQAEENRVESLGFGRRGGSSGSGEDHALSDAEIGKLLPGIRIISYPELEALGGRGIENALDGEGRLVILFLTESNTVGHWTSIHTTPDGGLECFDAYGLKPEGPKAWLSKSKRIALHEDRPILSGLIREAEGRGIPVTFNPVPFQKSKLGVATCGRHVVVRLLKRNLDLPAYVRFIASAGGTPDEVVTRITNRLLHNA